VGMALLAVSRGTPMLVMGDERRRSQRGNNNAYNLDAVGSWMDWSSTAEADGFAAFTAALLAQRRSLAALRSGFAPQGRDGDGDGVADVAWLRADGGPADEATWASPSAPLVVRLDAREADPASPVRSVLVVYQRAPASSAIAVPRARAGLAWRRAIDTSAEVPASLPGAETLFAGESYPVQGRSLVVLVER